MDSFGISDIAVIPVRSEPSERSEMVSQILFGETYKITDENPDWIRIELTNDKYQGWINKKSFLPLNKEYSLQSVERIKTLFAQIIQTNTSLTYYLPFGSYLPFYNQKTGEFFINSNNYKLTNSENNKTLSVIDYAIQFINSPYLWGGKNPFGIDCSGLVQLVYSVSGYSLTRDASQQVNHGKTIEFLDEVKPGDLAFFDNPEGLITHVGILISKNEIIHSSGKVRIDRIDYQGIFNTEHKKYTHKLRIIKRITQ